MPARPTISIEDFVADSPTVATISPGAPIDEPRLIEGVVLTSLTSGADHRGSLSELLTTRDGLDDPIVHVYQVFANPGSVRAWVFHRLQDDRLAFTNGRLRVVLYDLRPDSPTYGQLDILDL
ncbi:MAG: polysaccharide biosynthesis protein, partial [Pseudorhodoplanes sp.]